MQDARHVAAQPEARPTWFELAASTDPKFARRFVATRRVRKIALPSENGPKIYGILQRASNRPGACLRRGRCAAVFSVQPRPIRDLRVAAEYSPAAARAIFGAATRVWRGRRGCFWRRFWGGTRVLARSETRIRRASQKHGKFNTKIATNSLTGKTLGSIGCGRCGRGPHPVVVNNASISSSNLGSLGVCCRPKQPLRSTKNLPFSFP